MVILIILAVGISAALMLSASSLIRKLAAAGGRLPVTPEWIDEISVERYRPMLRLLDSADLEFLRSQPGYTRRMESRMRQQRCQIFRGYLRALDSDFGRVCAALKVLLVQSRHDRPDLAAALLRNQVTFALMMSVVSARVVLYRWGIASVDVRRLVAIFDQMRLELRSVVPATAPAAA
jgi:hypothetical protein